MDYTEAFEQIDIFRIHLIEEEKSTLTVQKYIRDITRLFAYLSSEKTLTKQCIIKYKGGADEILYLGKHQQHACCN